VRLGRQRAALQAFDHVGVLQRVLRIEVMRLGTERVHARAFQLFDDQDGELPPERGRGGAVGGFEHRTGPFEAVRERKTRAVHVGARLVLVVAHFGIHQEHLLESMALPVTHHRLVVEIRHHRMVLLAVAVPDEHRQEVRDLRIGNVEMQHAVEHIGLAHAAVADRDRKQRAGMQQGAGHGEVLALSQRARGREDARDRAGQMTEQAVTLAKAFAQLGDGADAHGLERGVEKHGAVVARRVMADFGDDVGVPEHHQRAVGLGTGGKAAGMPRGLGTGNLQGQVTQRIGAEQGLVDRRRVRRVANRVFAWCNRGPAMALEIRPGLAEILDSLHEIRRSGRNRRGGMCGAGHKNLLGISLVRCSNLLLWKVTQDRMFHNIESFL